MAIRPIDANALKREILNQLNRFDTSENEFNNCYPYWIFSKTLKEAPTLDYAPVRRAEWVEEIEPNVVTVSGRDVHLWRCSACGFSWANKHDVMSYYKYCPNCGAKMDAKEDA